MACVVPRAPRYQLARLQEQNVSLCQELGQQGTELHQQRHELGRMNIMLRVAFTCIIILAVFHVYALATRSANAQGAMQEWLHTRAENLQWREKEMQHEEEKNKQMMQREKDKFELEKQKQQAELQKNRQMMQHEKEKFELEFELEKQKQQAEKQHELEKNKQMMQHEKEIFEFEKQKQQAEMQHEKDKLELEKQRQQAETQEMKHEKEKLELEKQKHELDMRREREKRELEKLKLQVEKERAEQQKWFGSGTCFVVFTTLCVVVWIRVDHKVWQRSPEPSSGSLHVSSSSQGADANHANSVCSEDQMRLPRCEDDAPELGLRGNEHAGAQFEHQDVGQWRNLPSAISDVNRGTERVLSHRQRQRAKKRVEQTPMTDSDIGHNS